LAKQVVKQFKVRITLNYIGKSLKYFISDYQKKWAT